MQAEDERIDLKKEYGKNCLESVEDFVKENNINVNGLSSKKAQEQIEKYGLNEVSQSKPKKWYNYLFQSLVTPFNLILLGIVLVLIYTDIVLTDPPNYANIIVITILILISTLLDFFEVYKSNKAAEKLKKLVEVKTTVYRNGKEVKVPLKRITIVML